VDRTGNSACRSLEDRSVATVQAVTPAYPTRAPLRRAKRSNTRRNGFHGSTLPGSASRPHRPRALARAQEGPSTRRRYPGPVFASELRTPRDRNEVRRGTNGWRAIRAPCGRGLARARVVRERTLAQGRARLVKLGAPRRSLRRATSTCSRRFVAVRGRRSALPEADSYRTPRTGRSRRWRVSECGLVASPKFSARTPGDGRQAAPSAFRRSPPAVRR